jgi:predicted lipoprotein with Yx(FWY)xxD motif
MNTFRSGTFALLLAAAILGGCAGDRVTAPAEMRNGVLTDWYSHQTLYTFDKDPTNPTRSVCNDACAVNWPPFRPSATDRPTGDFTIFKRDDGSLQWAYKGKPLYTYVKDTKTGDRLGEGVNGVWQVVK